MVSGEVSVGHRASEKKHNPAGEAFFFFTVRSQCKACRHKERRGIKAHESKLYVSVKLSVSNLGFCMFLRILMHENCRLEQPGIKPPTLA